MPMSPDKKRAYNRARMAKRRATTRTPTNVGSDGASGRPLGSEPPKFKSYRDANGTLVLAVATRPDRGNEHYWGWVSKAPEGTRQCFEFEFGPGHWIGGCGMIVAWEGKPLSTNVNGEPDLATAIIDSSHFKEIQGKMPVTKARER